MNIVVLGAGKTGRGFIGRMLSEEGKSFVFIDKDRQLIEKLNVDKCFSIEFFGNTKAEQIVSNFDALVSNTNQARTAIGNADLIFVSVGISNFPDIVEYITDGLNLRRDKKCPLFLVTAENAIKPAEKLLELIRANMIRKGYSSEPDVIISESAIFCTTIEKNTKTLDILSEDYNELPFDGNRADTKLSLPSFMKPEKDFSILLMRKIYTYNCASAVISYLGSLKGYIIYSDAANDNDIVFVLKKIYGIMEEIICKKYNISHEEQKKFAELSFNKFQNRFIIDTIERNARDAKRKLYPDERIIGPARLMDEFSFDTSWIAIIAAATIQYGQNIDKSLINYDGIMGCNAVISQICQLNPDAIFSQKIKDYYIQLAEGKPLHEIIRSVESVK